MKKHKDLISIWNKLGGINALLELLDDSWIYKALPKRKRTGKKIEWKRYGGKI